MSYVALYRKYRPNNFSNVVGQEMTVNVLTNAIKNNHISHAYLFCGPRGTGKTSIAKIFAKAVNCLNFNEDICGQCEICEALKQNDNDIIEIDAASNNGVDEIRTLRDNVKLMPSFCKYKIYIIDEVHMLSTGAFNALLKTLEEPPSHVIFILATTEPNKIPLTILSRCQRFDFNKVESDKIYKRLKYITQEEKVTLNDEVIKYIAENTDGCLRDAVNLLDQTISLGKSDITLDDVDKLSGKISQETVFSILDAIISKNYSNLLDITKKLCEEGKNLTDIVNNLLAIMRDLTINSQITGYFDENYENKLSLYELKSEEIVKISKILNETINEMKYSNNQQIIFEIYMMNLINTLTDSKIESNNKELERKEEKNNKENLVQEGLDKVENLTNNKVAENSQEENKIDENKTEENMREEKDNLEILEIKEIRINNTLAGASKDILKKLLNDYDKINDYFSNKKYNTFVELLNNAKIVAASEDYLIISFKNEADVTIYDKNLKQIELFLKEIYQKEYKTVAINEEKWSKTKEEYINNKKNNISYVIMDENVVKLIKNDNSKIKKEDELESSATDIFGENMVSIK